MDVVEALRVLVSHPTIADVDPAATDHAPFDALHADFGRLFPNVNRACEVRRLFGDALLIRWPGRTSEAPIVLMAHLDVVPIEPGDTWTHPPFEGVVADGMIWGRGTLDAKSSVAAICAAVEDLAAEGFVPARDVWLSFGCNEEVAGPAAPLAVEELRRLGVQPWFVLDEGGAVVSEALPGIAAPLALLGVGEKGMIDLDLTATASGGHSSMPGTDVATVRLARAVVALSRRPFPSHLTDATVEMFTRLGPHATGAFGAVLKRARELRRVLEWVLPRLGGETAAMTRTTVAVTMLAGAPARNALASSATAAVNVRVMPGETVAQTVEGIRRRIGDRRVEVTVRSGSEPSTLAPVDDAAFRLLDQVTRDTMPDAVPVPYLVMATTDGRHFQAVWPRVYRFNPFRYSPAQRQSLHNVDERIGVDSLREGVTWYRTLLERL